MPLKNPNENTIWEITLEEQVKKLQQQVKMLNEEKNMGICWDEKTKTKLQKSLKVELEEINQKILAKDVRLKRYRDMSSNTNKTGHSKITKENSTNKLMENARGQPKQVDTKKAKLFWCTNGNRKNIKERLNG